MKRPGVTMRDAVISDAARLLEVWDEVIRRAEPTEQTQEMESVIRRATESPHQSLRVAVAHTDAGLEVVGAVFLQIATLTPINLEPTVQVISPHVLPEFRRQGIGRLLMEQAVNLADEAGIGHVTTAAAASSREANRFMARLAMRSHATMRVGPTATLRARVEAMAPPADVGGRQRSRMLAVRRSQRRARDLSD